MPGYRDWDMLNQAITGLGNSFDRRRQENLTNQREAERMAMEHEMRNIQSKREDRMREAATKPTYRWTSGGVEQTAHSLADFGEMIQAHPADPTKDDFSELDLEGMNDHGVLVKQKIRIPNSISGSDEAKKSAAQAIKAFAEYTGSTTPQAPTVMTTPGGQEIITRGRQMVKGAPPPGAGSTTTTIKTEPPPAWAPPGTPPTRTTNTTTRVPNQPAQPARQPVAGYKVGARYKGGLIYLGGDPNDQNSWKQAQ